MKKTLELKIDYHKIIFNHEILCYAILSIFEKGYCDPEVIDILPSVAYNDNCWGINVYNKSEYSYKMTTPYTTPSEIYKLKFFLEGEYVKVVREILKNKLNEELDDVELPDTQFIRL